ncbi:MAG: BrnA antitoxin family protein [Gammaproteobacteria bacterium]|nr:BrnA antitoxin family protein [Gammaproteobacteria bacterium]
MAKGFFSRFSRPPRVESPAGSPEEAALPAAEPATAVAEIVRGIAHQGLPPVPRKAAISLRLDADVLDWFRAQGAGYQTRINAVLRAYMEASL